MSASITLMDELKKGGYDSCLMTTYSVNFAFYEDVLLRKMMSAGIENHLLFVDHLMCASAIKAHSPKKAGQFYGLVPMHCNAAFHPKVFILLGKKKGLLVVGSHNLTLSGFGNNLEVTNVVRFDVNNSNELPLFKEALEAFSTWLSDYGHNVPKVVNTMLKRAKDMAPWLKSNKPKSENHKFLYSSASQPVLWEQLESRLPPKVDSIIGLSAFFDMKGEFLDVLSEKSIAKPIVGIHPPSVNLNKGLLFSKAINFKSTYALVEDRADNYLHAKAISFRSDSHAYFVSGSANFSSSGWLKFSLKANAEAVLFLEGERAESAVNSLNLAALENEESVTQLPEDSERYEDDGENECTNFLYGRVLTDKTIEVQLDTELTSAQPFKRDFWGDYLALSFSNEGSSLRVVPEQLTDGEIFYLKLDNNVVATVITLDSYTLEKRSESSDERDLRLAMTSLETDSPQFELLFKCIDRLLPQSIKDGKSFTSTTSSHGLNAGSVEKDSLLVSIHEVKETLGKTGRRSIASDGLGVILDLFMNAIPSIQEESAALYREDDFGRNEEELVGSDDEVTSPQALLSEKQARLVQSKLKRLLNKIDKFLSVASDSQPLNESVSFLLMGLVLIENLSRYGFWLNEDVLSIRDEETPTQSNQESSLIVESVHYDMLFNTVFKHFFSEKGTPLEIKKEQKDAFNTEEYTKVLAYTAWLMFKLKHRYCAALPLSGYKKEVDRVNQMNARMLFVFQRLDSDAIALRETELLFEQVSAEATAWLHRGLNLTVEILYEGKRLKGYELVRSLRNGFYGYCLFDIKRNNERNIELCSISNPLSFLKQSLGA
ncbi:phospholipase D-like domain-containing protein [Vibrio comitans]